MYYFFVILLLFIYLTTMVLSQSCGKPANEPNVSGNQRPPWGGRRPRAGHIPTSAPGMPPLSGIMHGQLVRPHSWPWQAYMLACPTPGAGCIFCGGSLIAEDKVLTAAHCVNKKDTGVINPSTIKIRLGTDNTRDPVGSENGDIEVGVKSIAVHSGWSFGTFENDVAVLTLDKKVSYTNNISPACVATTDPPAGTMCYATGWGYTESGWKDELYQVGIPIATDDDCKKEVDGPIDGKICFDVKNSKDTCQGDSGGPVVCKTYDGVWRIVGITSYGNTECGADGHPGIYTRVSYYQKWIMSNVQERRQHHNHNRNPFF